MTENEAFRTWREAADFLPSPEEIEAWQWEAETRVAMTCAAWKAAREARDAEAERAAESALRNAVVWLGFLRRGRHVGVILEGGKYRVEYEKPVTHQGENNERKDDCAAEGSSEGECRA